MAGLTKGGAGGGGSGSVTFGTPALTLGTSNADGSTDEAIRRDATILAFDATAPSTQAFGDAASAGVATVPPRRDHKHAMPANPVTAHEAASDPHAGYRLESTDHDHSATGLQAGKLAQANTHQSPDTDSATSSLHHTIGSGANQAAAGTHTTPTMVASGASHAGGHVPDPPSSGGTTKFLREDGTWAVPSGGGSVATDTIFDAKGDLPVGTGADTSAKLSVGANGTSPIADSSQTTGLRYAKVGMYDAYVCVRDEKTQNTAGGTATLGAWRTRDLNTEHADTAGIASVATNQITLAAGTYHCFITCPARSVQQNQARLQNITDGATLIVGSPAYDDGTIGTITHSIIAGRFTLAAQKVLEVQHQVIRTQSTNGFGVPANLTTEVYTCAEFWREVA